MRQVGQMGQVGRVGQVGREGIVNFELDTSCKLALAGYMLGVKAQAQVLKIMFIYTMNNTL